jgi:hypothetical protein
MKRIGRNKIFAIVWGLCALMLITLQLTQKERLDFVGIVGLRSQEITSSTSARVKKIHVISGQNVKKGDLLLELENPQMELELNRLTAELDYLLEQKEIFSTIVNTDKVEHSNIEGLKKQVAILEKEKSELYIFSKFDGKVESILKKEGENAQPHLPIMTMLESTPTTIRGYLHETVVGEVSIGTEVLVSHPASGKERSVIGKVLSFGSSIVPFPERLLKDPTRPVWGREVLIEIPENNNLILGEKVYIAKFEATRGFFNQAYASEEKKRGTKLNLRGKGSYLETKRFNLKAPGQKKIEGSGVTFLPKINKYLVVSDGRTTKKKTQVVMMNANGEGITDAGIKGLNGLADFEAISIGADETVYVLSSLSAGSKTSSGKGDRYQLIRLKREGMDFIKSGSVSLYSLLKDFLKKNSGRADLGHMLKNGELSIDIEGMAVEGNGLLIGLRTRLNEKSEALVFRLGNLNQIFEKNEIAEIKLAHQIKLVNSAGQSLGISDLSLCGNDLIIAAAPASKDEQTGGIYRLRNNSVEKLIEYKNEKPEGVHCHDSGKTLMVTFDHGDDPSFGVIYEQQN